MSTMIRSSQPSAFHFASSCSTELSSVASLQQTETTAAKEEYAKAVKPKCV